MEQQALHTNDILLLLLEEQRKTNNLLEQLISLQSKTPVVKSTLKKNSKLNSKKAIDEYARELVQKHLPRIEPYLDNARKHKRK